MGLFNRKKKDEPQVAAAAVPAFEPLDEPFKVINCATSVSLDGQKHTMESDGSVRFYSGVVSIYAVSSANQAKNMLRPMFVPNIAPQETFRYPYSEISRAYFVRKVTAKLEFSDGKYAFVIMMKADDRERFTALFAEHGVTVEPFSK